MDRRTQKGLSLALALSIASFTLVGCNALPTVSSQSTDSVSAASTQTGREMAADFAAMVRQQGIQATLNGAVVSLTQPDGSVVRYDFSHTPKTGKVDFSTSDGLNTSFAYNPSDTARFSPWKLAWIAARMVYGGVKAWYWYTHSHTGSEYNREELVKAILYAMLEQGMAGLPAGFLLKRLAPIVWKWITGEDPIKPTLRELWDRAKGDVDSVANILKEGLDLQKAGQL